MPVTKSQFFYGVMFAVTEIPLFLTEEIIFLQVFTTVFFAVCFTLTSIKD